MWMGVLLADESLSVRSMVIHHGQKTCTCSIDCRRRSDASPAAFQVVRLEAGPAGRHLVAAGDVVGCIGGPVRAEPPVR